MKSTTIIILLMLATLLESTPGGAQDGRIIGEIRSGGGLASANGNIGILDGIRRKRNVIRPAGFGFGIARKELMV